MESNRFKRKPLASSFGDVAAMPSSVTFDDTAAGEVVDVFELPIGAELIGLDLVNDALGAGTTMAYGYRYKDEDDGAAAPSAFKAAASSATAGASSLPMHPLVFDVPVIITATLAGANATGKLTVTPKYRYLGTK